MKPYSLQEVELIHKYYIENRKNKAGWLDDLSKLLDRPKANISRFARERGLTNRRRGVDSVVRMCESCGNEFITKPYQSQQTCSKKCGLKSGSEKRKGKPLWEERNHPKGMLGKTHTPLVRKRMSERMQNDWKDENSAYNSEKTRQLRSDNMSKLMVGRMKTGAENYSRTIKGWREVGGQRHFYRSKWEMNIAYYLEWLKVNKEIKDWDYESETFWFEKIRRGVRSYTPDFKITENDGSIYFIEVKGWMDSKSKTKLDRMKKYHPEIKMVLYDEKQYKTLKRQIGGICKWE